MYYSFLMQFSKNLIEIKSSSIRGLCAPRSLGNMLAGPLEVLVASPTPDRSKVRGQTKSNLLILQVGGFAQGQQPCHLKTFMLPKQQRET